MGQNFKQNNIPAPKEQYMTEVEVRELIAASLANWTGITRFRTIESVVTTITDFTNSQHNHQNAAGGGQLTTNAISGQIAVPQGGTGQNTFATNAILIGQGAGALSTITGLAGTKVYYVSDTSGGAVTRKLTFNNGVLISET